MFEEKLNSIKNKIYFKFQLNENYNNLFLTKIHDTVGIFIFIPLNVKLALFSLFYNNVSQTNF